MANEIRAKQAGNNNFTITLASLANGSARQTTAVANSNASASTRLSDVAMA